MNKRLSALTSSMPFTELEAARSEFSRNNCLTTATSTPKLTWRIRKLSGSLTPLTLHGSHLSGTIGNKTILGVTLECTLGYGFANTRNLFQRFANGAMDAVDIQMHEADAEFFASDDRTPAERAYIARR